MAFSAGGDGGRRSPELPAHVGILSTCWQHAGIDSQVPTPTTAKQERSPGSEAGARLGFVVTVTRDDSTVMNTHAVHNVRFLDNQRSVK